MEEVCKGREMIILGIMYMFMAKGEKVMKNGKYDVGTIIKGKDLKGSIICKILPEDMLVRESYVHTHQYKVGMNMDIFFVKENCEAGMYFYLMEDICNHLDQGTKLAIIEVPDDEDVYVDNGKFRAHRIRITEIMPYSETATWKYLYENGADITAQDDYAVRWAAKNGHLEIVRYLYEKGTNIMAKNNYAVRLAACNGHLEVVRYLYEKGAYIIEGSIWTVKQATKNGHTDVVEYLREMGV